MPNVLWSHRLKAIAKWAAIVFGVLILISALTTLIAPKDKQGSANVTSSTQNSAPKVEQKAISNSDDKVAVGEEGYINVQSPKAILALSEDGFKEITKIYIAGDTAGIGEFLMSGKGFAVPNGTKVLVIDSAVGSRKVRVLDGDMTLKTGWIAMEWVAKTK